MYALEGRHLSRNDYQRNRKPSELRKHRESVALTCGDGDGGPGWSSGHPVVTLGDIAGSVGMVSTIRAQHDHP